MLRPRAAAAASGDVAAQLLALAVPLVPLHGFSARTLAQASLLLPSPLAPPAAAPFSRSTINALFPSAPPRPRPVRSLSRSQLRADAEAQQHGAPDGDDRERVGPAKALVEAWLEEGRRAMVEHVRKGAWKGDEGVREALRTRLAYNEPVLHMLPQALALLGTSTHSPLSSLAELVPFPSPTGVLEHVARIAHDAAKATGDESQGVAWYRSRARIGTLYSLSELHLLSPSSLPPSERVAASQDLLDRLLDGTASVEKSVRDAEQYGNWIVQSWMGMGRSLGL